MIWAVIVLGGLYLLGMADAPSAEWGKAISRLIFPVWIFLRLVDLITAGPRRRRAAREVREGAVPLYSTTPGITILPPGPPSRR